MTDSHIPLAERTLRTDTACVALVSVLAHGMEK